MSLMLSKKMTTGGKLRLILWKNYLLQKRHYFQTFFDIFLPVIVFIFYVLLYKYTSDSSDPRSHAINTYESQSIDSLDPHLWLGDEFFNNDSTATVEERRLIFTPDNAIFKNLMEQVSKMLSLEHPIGVMNRKELETTMHERKMLAGIEFHHSEDISSVPDNLAYSIRFPAELRTRRYRRYWRTNLLYSLYAHLARQLHDPEEDYYKEGFLTIQNAIAKAFTNIMPTQSAQNLTLPNIRVQRFPSPDHFVDVSAHSLRELIPLFLMLVLCFVFMNTVRMVSIEKEKQLKETMKIMGLSSWMHYLGWFIRTTIMLSTSMVAITFLLTMPCFAPRAIFPLTSFFLMLLFFVGYCISLITFSFMICAFFAKAKSAVTAAMALWFFTSLPYLLVDEEHLSVTEKALLCICPNSALSYGVTIISDWEVMEIGLNWRSAFQQQYYLVQGDLTIATMFGLFIGYAVLFFLITVYVENVMPGAYGVAKPWYFIFTKKFWQSFNQYEQFDDQTLNDHFEMVHAHADQSNFEAEPTNQPIGIEIKNLTKKFIGDTAVVNNLSLNIYYDQITSLLGHNGAGKTTTISMLTGMIEPTSGTAQINGFDIRRNMDSARTSMGFCPQHNILFDSLTVREHILFYSCLKGLTTEAAENEVQKYTRLMDLEGKANAISSTLSGGMKRKLSVVIALCGDSKVVFLDEPTAGMDPGARRALWDILLAEKKDRSILMTTHFMDEADVLSDRIAILADGDLKCTGSTFFLKKRFGTGYHLICAKDTMCDSRLVTELLRKYMPDIQVENENETELCYILPEEKNEMLTIIFKDLEINESQLNLNGFGVSLTTLEEIFMKLGKSENVDTTFKSNGVKQSAADTEIILDDNVVLLYGWALWKNQAKAMFRKRFLCWLRAWPSFVYYNIFVISMLALITFRIDHIFSGSRGLPSLTLDIDLYNSPVIVLQDAPTSKVASQLELNIRKTNARLVKIPGDIQQNLKAIANATTRDFEFDYAVAISFTDNATIAWFNDQMFHAAPISLNLIHNAVIQSVFKDRGIQVSNAPLPFEPDEETYDSDIFAVNVDSSFEFWFPFVLYMVMSILSAKYTSFYIEEKQCNAKFMQYVSGANMWIFWGVSILWDMITTIFIILLIIPILMLGQQSRFKSMDELTTMVLILLVYNFAMTPVICLWSLLFTKPSFGRAVVSIFNVIIVPALFLIYLLIALWAGGLFGRNAPDLRKFFLFPYPILTMFDALLRFQLYRNQSFDASAVFSHSTYGIALDLEVMFLTGLTAYAMLIFIELGGIRIIKTFLLKCGKPKIVNEDDNDLIDDDVQAEKRRIEQMTLSDLQSEAMVMKNVSKEYNGFMAVKNVSLSVKRADCFGLLGKNGAGKTTIFKMLTGETSISAGEIFTNGFNQKYQLSNIYEIIGYCPQFDALLPSLTCREIMEIFAMLRGIPADQVTYYVENCARNLDFIQHIDKIVKQLSGGNKRKLSTSLAFIGNLSVILLDEPSAGMDPATKRNLWNAIIQLRESGKSIVLTSHSMEECEALCTQITVLVNGKCKCLGSSQHLKNKFNKGFELKIKVKRDRDVQGANLAEVKNFVAKTFNGSIFRDEYQGVLTYSVPGETIKWSSVFGIMENAKKGLSIEDYSISQNSLEQVVLKLLGDQTEQNDNEFYGINFNGSYLKM